LIPRLLVCIVYMKSSVRVSVSTSRSIEGKDENYNCNYEVPPDFEAKYS